MTRILLTDPRLSSIASASLDQPAAVDIIGGVAIPAIAAASPSGISVRRDGDVALFKLDDAAVETAVRIEDGAALFFPHRSSAHRQLLAKLGIDE